MECYICKQTGNKAANCPNTNLTTMSITPAPTSSTEILTLTPLPASQEVNLPEPPKTNDFITPEKSTTVISLKRALSSSTEQDDPPSPSINRSSGSSQMPPPETPAKKSIAKPTKKKAKKEDTNISDKSRETIEQLYSKDPSSFNIPLQNLLAFLENTHGSSNHLKEAQEITEDIKLLDTN